MNDDVLYDHSIEILSDDINNSRDEKIIMI
jgi:hypothetical protein